MDRRLPRKGAGLCEVRRQWGKTGAPSCMERVPVSGKEVAASLWVMCLKPRQFPKTEVLAMTNAVASTHENLDHRRGT